MASDFYIQINGVENGPMNSKELMLLAQLGGLSPTDMVRMDGSDKWVLASRIKVLEFSPLLEEPKKEIEENIEEEIEEVLVVDPEPFPAHSFSTSSNTPVPPFRKSNNTDTPNQTRQSTDSITAPNNNLPAAPDYGFVEEIITVCNTMGAVTLIGSLIAVVFIGIKNSELLTEKAGLVICLMACTLIFGVIISITMFAMGQLLMMAIYGSMNLHYIMHSNLVAMRIMVNQATKKY